ncbi:DUF4249 domain-containing protein [Owenweeksia hongkongensis]|uniref:DUF4249 domain-containing protein n=1 Tax=Owenweeksia hongkongensis (strain DSM 17368 / CIP 108786 / JCM 12287 / NRRL B-23963 / UST20020801) TaxID=926562 RepID=G8R1I8_OWEHD|nr:DUF4249 domain-containing protein [Owenweeksia hongkongensis]AEV31727.1 hypothetical protein Oweho_0713 [Owenweeksia hongkongensis DSM 17368]
MKKLFIYSILLLSLLSCQKEIEFDYPEDEPRLTLFSVLRPQDTIGYYRQDSTYHKYIGPIEVLINQTTSVFEVNPAEPISDAKVLLFEDNSFAGKLLLDSNNNPNTWMESYLIYSMRRSIYKGKRYRVEVNHPDFPPASAEVTIPQEVPILKAEFDTTKFTVTFTFKDPPGQNYYRFSLYSFIGGLPFEITDPDITTFNFLPFDSILLKSPDQLSPYARLGYITDEKFSNKQKSITLKIDQSAVAFSTPIPEMSVYLENISGEYYKFLRTYDAHMATKDNPFAEGVKIHTNVKGGVGIVGTATTSSKLAIKK